MDYKENPPKNYKDQRLIEDLVNQYIEVVGLRDLAMRELAKNESQAYTMQNGINEIILKRTIVRFNEAIQQINFLLKDPKTY